MKLLSLIRFDLLMLPIHFFSITSLALPATFPGRKLWIRRSALAHPWSVLAHPAICTGASGDLYWHIQWSVLVGYAGRSISTHWMHILEFLVITGVAAANYSDCRKKKNIGNIIESSLINDWSFIFYWTFPLNGFSPTQAELVGVCQLRHALYHK